MAPAAAGGLTAPERIDGVRTSPGVNGDHEDHVAFGVPDAAAVTPFLVGELGGRPFESGPGIEFLWWQWQFARGGAIEIIEPDGPPGGFVHRFLEARGPGVHHVTFKVPDLAAAAARVVGRREALQVPVDRLAQGEEDAPRDRHVVPAVERGQQAAGQARGHHGQAQPDDQLHAPGQQAIVDQELGDVGLGECQAGAGQRQQSDGPEPTGVRPHEADLAARLEEDLKARLGVTAEVTVAAPASLPRSEGKTRRVITKTRKDPQ